MSTDGVVLMSIDGGVAVITLNRPERLNAWTLELENLYFDMLEECGRSPQVRVIVVTGAGRGFCAGADMDDLQALGDGSIEADERADARRLQTLALSIPKPVVAAINGPAAGLGLVHALMCDIRFAAEGAKLTTAFARRGLVAEHGISWILPRLIGPARALDLLLSGRVILAEEALELGLVNRVTPAATLMEETLAYARELASRCSPASMASMKRQVYTDLSATLPDALQRADGLMLESFGRADFVEGVSSFLERRDPRFQPLGA